MELFKMNNRKARMMESKQEKIERILEKMHTVATLMESSMGEMNELMGIYDAEDEIATVRRSRLVLTVNGEGNKPRKRKK